MLRAGVLQRLPARWSRWLGVGFSLWGCWLSSVFAAALPPSMAQPSSAVRLDADIQYIAASAQGAALSLDIYQALQPPYASKSNGRPVLLMFHGGGWLINDRHIMRQAALYLATHSNLLVVNVDYRLLAAEHNQTRLDDIVNDVLGALVWVRAHIAEYGGDPTRVAVTGDSAGAHLAAMVMLAKPALAEQPWPGDHSVLRFSPRYLPTQRSVASLAAQGWFDVQAAVLSYGVFDVKARAQQGFETATNGFWQWANVTPRGLFGTAYSLQTRPDLYDAISPLRLIPPAATRRLPPQFVHVGELDRTTPPAAVQQYVQALQAAEQPVQFKRYPARNHAYLDNGCNRVLAMCFADHAIEPLNDMLTFLRRTLGD